MIPQTKDNYLGIEIEFVADMTMAAANEMLIAAGLDDCCVLDTDGSVMWDEEDGGVPPSLMDTHNYWDGFELKLLCKESELFKLLPKLRKFFDDTKAKVNKSCGLHVHLDMRQRNLKLMYARLAAAQGEMMAIIAHHRRDNDNCEFATINNDQYEKFMTEIDDEGEDANGGIDYRYAVNILAYAKHNTIEIRAHEGTVNTMEIYNWCMYLLTILGSKRRTAGIKHYVEQRISKNRKPI